MIPNNRTCTKVFEQMIRNIELERHRNQWKINDISSWLLSKRVCTNVLEQMIQQIGFKRHQNQQKMADISS